MEHITSRHNPLMGHIRRLAGSAAYRWETGEFLCDSPKLLQEADLWGATVRTVLFTEGTRLPPFADAGTRLVQVSESVMEAVSPMQTPQGVVFSCLMGGDEPPARLEPGRYLLLEGVQDPGNVGTILRTADAFDASGLFLLEGCADLYNPKTVRATMGAIFRQRVLELPLAELRAALDENGLPLYGAALSETARDFREIPLDKAAVAVGSEGNGLSTELLAICDGQLIIPMRPDSESLNAGVAASVIMWEMSRGSL